MTILKFELSVLFTKSEIGPYSKNEDISREYKVLFNKDLNEEDLITTLGEIVNDQLEMYNYNVQEIPEDFEYDRNR